MKLMVYNPNSIMIALAIITGLVAFFTDLGFRRIPNWLTIPAMVLGILYYLLFQPAFWFLPLLGILFGFLILFIPYLFGGIGAGDVKLLMSFGALLGIKAVLWIFLIGAVFGGFMSIGYIFIKYRLVTGIFYLKTMLSALWNPESRHTFQSMNQQKRLNVPYGVALFIGLVITIIYRP